MYSENRPDFVVVGAGLFGSIIAKALHKSGSSVVVIDRGEPMAGSRPAACLMKPSWASSLGMEEYNRCRNLLDVLYGVRSISFHLPGRITTTVLWVPPYQILGEQAGIKKIIGNVVSIKDEEVVFQHLSDDSFDVIRPNEGIVVATGVWAQELVGPIPGLHGRTGWATFWAGQLAQNTIAPWAPYKQMVSFNYSKDKFWVGDGSAYKNPTKDREHQVVRRCSNHAVVQHLLSEYTTLLPSKIVGGIRPYLSNKEPAYLRRLNKRLLVATGGAKNGTLGAAWCAARIAGGLI